MSRKGMRETPPRSSRSSLAAQAAFFISSKVMDHLALSCVPAHPCLIRGSNPDDPLATPLRWTYPRLGLSRLVGFRLLICVIRRHLRTNPLPVFFRDSPCDPWLRRARGRGISVVFSDHGFNPLSSSIRIVRPPFRS